MTEESTLSKLLRKKEEGDEYLLYELLKDIIGIEKDSGELIFSKEYGKLSEKGKVLVVLLAQKARVRLGKAPKGFSKEELRPKEIAELSGVKSSTVRVSLMKLREEGLVKSTEDGYFVPNYALPKVKEFLGV